MAVTYAVSDNLEPGPDRVGRHLTSNSRLTLTGTYVTGGFALTANDFQMSKIKHCVPGSAWNGTEMMVAVYDSANEKIKLGWTGAVVSTELDEITNGDTVTSFVLDVTVKGV